MKTHLPALALILTTVAAPVTARQAAPPAPQAATISTKPALPGIDRPRPAPPQQQSIGRGAPVNGVLVLYGNERCPTNSDGDEIVICERRSAEEQFRVPRELRNLEVTPENRSWAAKAQGTLDAGVGVNGTGSCSTVGPGGQTGCFGQASRVNRATNQVRAQQEASVP